MTSLTPEHGSTWTAIRISSRWGGVRRALEAGRQLRVAEGRLLWLLRDDQPRTLRQIADALDLEQSTVNRQVHAALDSGVVRRFRREDGPAYLVEVTDVGRERFRTDVTRQARVHEQALATIPEQERETFLEHLAGYVDALGEAAADATPDRGEG